MKILVLGSNGMLGNMVKKYLEQFFEIETIIYRWPSNYFRTAIINSNSNFLINCVGAIPQRTKNFDINWELPIWLDANFKGNIVHPGTDCEMDDDEYGLSKRKAANWIIKNSTKTKIIKASIIGPEINGSVSMLNWFLSNEDYSEVNGYSNHKWNGVTTFHWAKFCKKMIESWSEYAKRTVLGSDCLSKYEMCKIFNKVYGRNIIVNSFETEQATNKCLEYDIKLEHIETQLTEMLDFINKLYK